MGICNKAHKILVYLLAPALFGGNEERGFEIVKELDHLKPLASKQLLLEYHIEEDNYIQAKQQFYEIHNNFYLNKILHSKVNPITSDYIRYGIFCFGQKKHLMPFQFFKHY